MAWPQSSNWQLGAPLSAWWLQILTTSASGPVSVCAVQGRGFVVALQRKCNALVSSALQRPLTIDGNWGNDTQSALINVAHQLAFSATNPDDASVYTEIENRLNTASRAHTIDSATLRFGIWVAYYLQAIARGATGATASAPLDRIMVPLAGSLVLPMYGHTPDDDRGVNGGQPTCWDRDRDTPPVPATRDQVDQSRATGNTGALTPAVQGGATGGTTRSSSSKAPLIIALAIGAALLLGGKKKRRGRRR
jgi:hypothetical protein